MYNTTPVRKFIAGFLHRYPVSRYLLPLLSFIFLCIAVTDGDHYDGRELARQLSGDYYRAYITLSLLALCVLAWRRRENRILLWSVEMVFLCLLATNALKYALPLGRPPHMTAGIIQVDGGYSPGFPSAHTAFAFGLAWLILELRPSLAPLWFALSVGIGWSRVELFSHYPYQVLCGAILGAILGYWITHTPRSIFHSLYSMCVPGTTQPHAGWHRAFYSKYRT